MLVLDQLIPSRPIMDFYTKKPPFDLPPSASRRLLFPRSHRLIVTTSSGVYSWDADGILLLFRSGSGGIVAATKANNDSLAVADGRVVVLHDVKKGMHKRSYKLKGSDVGKLQSVTAR